MVALTPADRKWLDHMLSVIQDTWDDAESTQPTMPQYEGSDDYLRARFEEYVFGMLSSAKCLQLSPTAEDLASAALFGTEFLHAFRLTKVFQIWNACTDDTLCDLMPHRHPYTGKTSTVSDVALRLQAGLHDLRLEENLAPTREVLSAALQAGSAGLSRVASHWYQDLGWLASPSASRTDLAQEDSSRASTQPAAAASSSEGAPQRRGAELLSLPSLQATGAQGAQALQHLGTFLAAKQRAWSQAWSRAPGQGE